MSAPIKPAAKQAAKPAPTKSQVAAKKPVPATTAKEKLYPKQIVVTYTDHPERFGEGVKCLPALRVADTIQLLGLEDEATYTKRLIVADPNIDPLKACFKEEQVAFAYGKPSVRVTLWLSSKNRPFELAHAEKLAQDHLNRFWMFNGEAIIVDEYGEVISGQHRLAGHWIAEQLRLSKASNKDHAFTKTWPTEVTMECLVVFGVSSDPKVLRTLDNVRPRTLSDTIYTSPIFADLAPTSKKECSRMLDAAVDTLWQRTGAGDAHVGGPTNKFQTHSSSLEFLERHAKLKQCVRHIFTENAPAAGRLISAIDSLNVGHCAALMYLMAASETNPDTYRNMDLPSEKEVDFSRWDRAEDFFRLLGSGEDLKEVRMAIKALKVNYGLPPEEGGSLGGTAKERMSILVKAWFPFIEDEEVTAAIIDLAECYTVDAKGNLHFDHVPSLGGIDKEEQTPEEAAADKEAEPATPEEIEAAKKADRQAKVDEITARLKAAKEAKKKATGEGQTLAEEAASILSKRAEKAPTTRKEVEAMHRKKAEEADAELALRKVAEQEVDSMEEIDPSDPSEEEQEAAGQ